MNEQERRRFEGAKFRLGDPADFLGLSQEESDEVEERLALIAPSIDSIDWWDTPEDREWDRWQPSA